jgi:hypothetical protein
MHRTLTSVVVAAIVAALVASVAWAQTPAAQPVGIVSNVKVLSDKVVDISSLEAWKKSYIKDGMSDKDKALACFTTEITYQQADAPPMEYLQREDAVLDPIKLFNVYGYTLCSVSAANMACLGRYVGLKADNHSVNNHVLPQFFYDKAWHMYDGDLIEYFPKADGSIASLQEMADGITAWAKDHPDFPMGPDGAAKSARYKWMMADNNQWKTKGPEILSRNPYYDDMGWLPTADFAWGDTMQQFNKINNSWESCYSMGYSVNVQLRVGETLTRNWFNKGLHVNMGGGEAPGSLTAKIGEGSFRFTPKLGDLAPGRVGNGTLVYDVPLATGEFRAGALTADNLASKSEDNAAPAVHVKDADKPAVLDIRMPSSYVYVGGTADVNAAIGDGGSIHVLFSDNNGLDWKDVATIDKAGPQKIDLKSLAFRRYVYILRFVMKGKGTGLDSLKITNDIQHSQRPLPVLGQGDNTITFSAGNEGTITIEGATSLDPKNKGKQVTFDDFHPVLDGFTAGTTPKSEGKGSATLTVKTPGDMARLRISDYFLSQGKDSAFNIDVSFDDGKTWKTVDEPKQEELESGVRNHVGRHVTVSEVPAGTRSAQVRYRGNGGNNTIVLCNARIDADYKEPAGGFRPVQVTYVWEEGGLEKKDVHVAKTPQDSYKIKCDSKPVMKSIILELAKP